MTQEEKAKAYDEAVKKAREIAANPNRMLQLDDFEELFPGITDESEDKRIIRAINNMLPFIPDEAYANNGITKEGVLAWLEKPKEPIDPFDTKLFQDGVKEGRRLERADIMKEQQPEFPKDIEKDATQFCFDKGFNITPYQAKEIATHYLMIGHNFGYVEGRKNAHIPAKELGLPSSMDFKQEWSEEDEYLLGETVQHLEELIRIDKARHCGVNVQYYQRDIDWLKSRRPSDEEIKKAYTKGFNDAAFGGKAWKPSDEQMATLNEVIGDERIEDTAACDKKAEILESLYNDLKKL